MLKSLLNLIGSVQIRRIVLTSDGFGGTSTATTLTSLSRAAIWAVNSNDRYISDKILKESTHVLATYYGAYTFDNTDEEVIYDGKTYIITGHPEDVSNRNDILTVGLKLVT